jgi:hypothetical protein
MKSFMLAAGLLLAIYSLVTAQSLELKNHGDLNRLWNLPVTADGTTGFEGYPNSELNFINQMAARFTAGEGQFSAVNLYIDGITAGIRDSVIGYAGEQAMFAWPMPFNHVPQTFLKHATRFTAPDASRLTEVSIFAGANSASSDGFNDTLKVSFFRPFQPQTSTVKYGNENQENNPTWEFNFPVGVSRSAYGTRVTLPGGSLLVATEFWVQNMNHNTFLPAGDPQPNDTLVVRVWSSTNGLPDTELGVVRKGIAELTIKAWNSVSLQSLNIVTEVETDLVITFELERVDLQDHVAFSAGAATTPIIGRSVVRENGNWITISESASFGTGAAKGAELWIRAQYSSTSQIVDDPGTPDINAPLGEPVKVLMSELDRNAWNSLSLQGRGIEVNRNEDIWVVTELITVGTPDVLDLISAAAEPQVRNRSAVFLIDELGVIRWRFMQNTQFNNEYLLRKRATFTTEDNTQITDTIFLVLYGDNAGLPGNFLELKEVPLSSLTQGEFNRIDVTTWGALRDVFHIGVTSTFAANPFALATDDGTFDTSGQHTTSVYLIRTEQWVTLSSLEDVGAENLLMSVEYLQGTSIETTDNLPSTVQLMGNYPNPFNPQTTVQFSLPQSAHVLVEVFDMMGRSVARLQDAPLPAGIHQVEFNAGTLASGTYFVRLQAAGQVATSKMMLIK